ncbi:MAG: glutaredoxin domain-containing protein [Sulfurimonadaceae bacterium]|nr:glutaredoxin domain-containing protein [Sulfurimonadaceae bacterium]
MPQTPKKKPSGQKRPSQRKKPSSQKPRKGSGKPQGKQSKGVEIFTASFCPHCQDAKFYFRAKGIKFTEYNLERSKDAEKKFRGYGGKAIPLIIVKGKILRRWDQKAFEKLFNA